jgi:hypothetical protein
MYNLSILRPNVTVDLVKHRSLRRVDIHGGIEMSLGRFMGGHFFKAPSTSPYALLLPYPAPVCPPRTFVYTPLILHPTAACTTHHIHAQQLPVDAATTTSGTSLYIPQLRYPAPVCTPHYHSLPEHPTTTSSGTACTPCYYHTQHQSVHPTTTISTTSLYTPTATIHRTYLYSGLLPHPTSATCTSCYHHTQH